MGFCFKISTVEHVDEHVLRFVLTVQGSGYKGKILTRIMVSRSEIDMGQIKSEYKKKYGKTLYKDILVGLDDGCVANWCLSVAYWLSE